MKSWEMQWAKSRLWENLPANDQCISTKNCKNIECKGDSYRFKRYLGHITQFATYGLYLDSDFEKVKQKPFDFMRQSELGTVTGYLTVITFS